MKRLYLKNRLISWWKRLVFGVDVLYIIVVKVPLFTVSWSVGKVIGLAAIGFWVGVKDSWEDVR